jgi:hypothetical protein
MPDLQILRYLEGTNPTCLYFQAYPQTFKLGIAFQVVMHLLALHSWRFTLLGVTNIYRVHIGFYMQVLFWAPSWA